MIAERTVGGRTCRHQLRDLSWDQGEAEEDDEDGHGLRRFASCGYITIAHGGDRDDGEVERVEPGHGVALVGTTKCSIIRACWVG